MSECLSRRIVKITNFCFIFPQMGPTVIYYNVNSIGSEFNWTSKEWINSFSSHKGLAI